MKLFCCVMALLTFGSMTSLAKDKPATPEVVQAVLPAAGKALRIQAKCGQVDGKILISIGSPEAARLTLVGADCPAQNKDYAMTKIPKEVHLTDGAINVDLKNGPRFSYYIRPNPRFYLDKDFEAALKQWDQHPPASEHRLTVLARRRADSVEWWLDGRYLAVTPLAADQEAIQITLSGGASLAETQVEADPFAGSDRLLPLNLKGYSLHQGTATMGPLKLDREALRAYRLEGAESANRLDVGRSRWLGQSADSGRFYDRYYMRGAFDGIPESLILRVPKQYYTRAWLLCTVDPDKSPWMTVRIGRYREKWDGSGMSVGDTHVKVDPQDPVGLLEIKSVGTTQSAGPSGNVELPVYLIAVPLATDKVADYLQWEGLDPKRQDFGDSLDWFNVEFSRQIETRLTLNSGIFDAKPVGPESGVHILGVTLQSEPIQVLVKSEEEGFSFYQNQKPQLLLETRNMTDRVQAVKMQATLTDFEGATIHRMLTFKAAPGISVTPWKIGDLPLGWHNASLIFEGQADGTRWSQNASLSFALLPPDKRTAGAESPYGTWWFQGSHYTEPDPERILPLFHKMGFRHASPRIKGDLTPFEQYQVTPSMMHSLRFDHNKKASIKTDDWATFITNWPTVNTAMIFHETGIKGLSTELPYELTGAPPKPFSDEQREQLDKLRIQIEEQAATVRKLDPEMKLMIGNGTTLFNSLWFREKLPTNLWDYCGLEMAIQTMHPEGQPNGWNGQSFWIARQMADHYGYTNFPITTCFEVGYRATGPGGLSLKRQADWYTRDVLNMLAWRSPHINVALIVDVNASYYNSRWGSTGVFFRSPLHLPKPSFVSLSTLTLMLDGAEYLRAVPTGSTGVYCLEFRKKNEYVYAMWSSRGKRPVELSLDGSLQSAVDSMARDLKLKAKQGKIELLASESPCYVTTRQPIKAVALGTPIHAEVPLTEAQIVDSMRESDSWRMVDGGDEAFENYCFYWPMVKGDITMQNAATPSAAEKEPGLRLTLHPQPDVKDIVARYTVLEPVAGPRPIKGQPDTLGVWVNGNSGWGRIYFEFTDAEGRRWISNRSEGRSWDISDWEGETNINHDGWRLISLPLPATYPSGYYKPSARHWRCIGKDGSEIEEKSFDPAWPISFSRIYVVMREKLVYLTEMTPPTSDSIELRNVTAGRRDE